MDISIYFAIEPAGIIALSMLGAVVVIIRAFISRKVIKSDSSTSAK